jgi:hypothetical protein
VTNLPTCNPYRIAAQPISALPAAHRELYRTAANLRRWARLEATHWADALCATLLADEYQGAADALRDQHTELESHRADLLARGAVLAVTLW